MQPNPPAPTFSPILRRYCIRCADCLAVAFVHSATRPRPIDCGACGGVGTIETMGEVQGARIGEVVECSACDDRCTQAKGHNCDCPCGGANHGTGAVVEVFVATGKAPAARMPASDKARAVATEWRSALAAVEELRQRMRNARPGLHWPPEYLRQGIGKAKEARQHGTRMRRLQEARDKALATWSRATGNLPVPELSELQVPTGRPIYSKGRRLEWRTAAGTWLPAYACGEADARGERVTCYPAPGSGGEPRTYYCHPSMLRPVD